MQVFSSLGQLPDGAEKKEMENQWAQELQTSFLLCTSETKSSEISPVSHLKTKSKDLGGNHKVTSNSEIVSIIQASLPNWGLSASGGA